MKDLSVSSGKANLIAVPIAFFSVLVFTIPYIHFWNTQSIKEILSSPFLKLQIYIPALLLGIFLHEIIHAAAFVFIAKVSKNNVTFGFQRKTITPYVHCKVPVKVSFYRTTLLAPGLLLGIIPALFSVVSGQGWLLIYACIFLIGAGGDFLIIWLLRKTGKNELVQDHPTRCGCIII